MKPEDLGRHRSWLRKRARLLMGSRLRGWTESGDLAQQAQFEAWRAREGKSFPNPAAFRGWLLRILANLAARESHRRDIDLVEGGELLAVEPTRSPSQLAQIRDSGKWIRERLGGLNERERDIVLCRIVDGLSFALVGERHGVTEGNARVIFHRGMEKLRRGDELDPPS